jgi:hypothetical protein
MVGECDGKHGEILANYYSGETYPGYEPQISLPVFCLVSGLETDVLK